MTTPLVTVVIPCYNHAHYLTDAIDSARAQSYERREIIVVDDGSSDETVAVASGYRDVRVISQANAGLAAARNSGIRASRGDCLVFLDADDRLLPDALTAGARALATYPECAFTFGHYEHIAADGERRAPPTQACAESGHYRELLRVNYIGMHATVMYRRATFDTYGGFDPSLLACEDYELYLRVARQAPIRCHHATVAEYRRHRAGLSRDSRRMLRAALCVLRSEWPHVRCDVELERAWRDGARFWCDLYGRQLARDMRKDIHAHRWWSTVTAAGAMLRYYPRGLAQLWPRARRAR